MGTRYVRAALVDAGLCDAVRSFRGTGPPEPERANELFEMCIGTSGTIETLALMCAAIRKEEESDLDSDDEGKKGKKDKDGKDKDGKADGGDAPVATVDEGLSINTADLRNLTRRLCEATTDDARMRLPGMVEKRKDTLTAGAIILEEVREDGPRTRPRLPTRLPARLPFPATRQARPCAHTTPCICLLGSAAPKPT